MAKIKSKIFFRGKKIFVGVDVHKKRWVVTVRTYNLELKTFSMIPSAEELERFLVENYEGAFFILYMNAVFQDSGFTITFIKEDII